MCTTLGDVLWTSCHLPCHHQVRHDEAVEVLSSVTGDIRLELLYLPTLSEDVSEGIYDMEHFRWAAPLKPRETRRYRGPSGSTETRGDTLLLFPSVRTST